MCTSPLCIENKSTYHDPWFTSATNEVPCGKCAECRASLQAEWRTRIFFEIKKCYKNGGLGLFLLFTYNDNNVPYFFCPPMEETISEYRYRKSEQRKHVDKIRLGLSSDDLSESKYSVRLDDRFKKYFSTPGFEKRPSMFEYYMRHFHEELNSNYDPILDLNFQDYQIGEDLNDFLCTDIMCFNKQHIQDMLATFKVYMHRHYGKGSYKFMLVSEYGLDPDKTCRPHYHFLLLLDSKCAADWQSITEYLRSLWSYGFMFPKYDENRKCYVDNDIQPTSPLLRSAEWSANYLSKYMTKEFDFYNVPLFHDVETNYLPVWRLYSRDPLFRDSVKGLYYKCCMMQFPFHLQSKGIGEAIFDYYNDEQILKAVSDGLILPPVSANSKPSIVPLPQYIVNKLLFRSVRSNRKSSLTHKFLYDRHLTEFAKAFSDKILEGRINKFRHKVFEWVLSSQRLDKWSKRSCVIGLSEHLAKCRDLYPDYLRLLGKYHYVVSKYSDGYINHVVNKGLDLFDDNVVRLYNARYRDTEFKKRFSGKIYQNLLNHEYDYSKYNDILLLHESLCEVMKFYRNERAVEKEKLDRHNLKIRRDLVYKYDKLLC